MNMWKITTAIVFAGIASTTMAQGNAELAAKQHAVCSEFGRLAEAIWKAKSTRKVADFNPDNGMHRRISASVLANDSYIKIPRDAFNRGYAICEDAIEEGVRARMGQ